MTEVEQPEWMKGYVPKPGWTKGMPSPNPKGRPPGQNKQTKLLKRMLEDAGDVLDAVLTKAKEGDPASAGLVLSRILPTLRAQSQTVEFDLDPTLPLAAQVEQVLAAISMGKLAPDVGRQIIEAIGTLGNIRAVEDFERRLVIVEGKVVT